MIQLKEVVTLDLMKPPGASTWATMSTSFYSIKSGFTCTYDPPTGLVKVERNGDHFCVHITRCKEMKIADKDDVVAPVPKAGQQPKQPIIRAQRGEID